jgi:hypothetical protein
MAWIKVPPEHHPLFLAALPRDPRVETQQMFGGIAAKVNGHIFAGLFGRSTMVWLPEPDRAAALALEGAGPFDPMGDGRARSDKVMLPESMMDDAAELGRWLARAFAAAKALPMKAAKAAPSAKTAKKAAPTKAAKAAPATKAAKAAPATKAAKAAPAAKAAKPHKPAAKAVPAAKAAASRPARGSAPAKRAAKKTPSRTTR